MKLIGYPAGFLMKWFTRNPQAALVNLVFVLGFSLIAANAMFSQSMSHPAPMFGETDQQQTRSIPVPRILKPDLSKETMETSTFETAKIPVPVANPIRGLDHAAQSSLVREIQSGLAALGIYEGAVDGIRGHFTEQAIMRYQKDADMIPDGLASYALLGNIKSAVAVSKVQTTRAQKPEPVPVSAQPMMIVLDADFVARVQSGLREVFGDEAIVVDGLLGRQTREAIERFQSHFKLDATGEIDEQTILKLREVGIVDKI